MLGYFRVISRTPGRAARRRFVVATRQRAFTLVELLVVITIIGILIALLLPAVQSAREAARQTQCANNLRQWSLGALSHLEAHGFFPTGGCKGSWYVGEPDKGFRGSKQPGGWFYNILPYVEQQAVHDVALGDPDKRAELWTKQVAQPIALAFCPTRRRPHRGGLGAYPEGQHWRNINPPEALAHNDYAVNLGNSPVHHFGGPEKYVDFTGISYMYSEVKMSDIRDGSSNTYMMGEKYLSATAYYDGMAPGDDNCIYSGHDWDIGRWTRNTSADLPIRDRPGYAHDTSFGSAHSAGVNMAFCDGSVRRINYSIDQELHSWLGDRADGEAIDASKF